MVVAPPIFVIELAVYQTGYRITKIQLRERETPSRKATGLFTWLKQTKTFG